MADANAHDHLSNAASGDVAGDSGPTRAVGEPLETLVEIALILHDTLSELCGQSLDTRLWTANAHAYVLRHDLAGAADALRPFANFAADNVEAGQDDHRYGVWAGNNCERERIVDWFGPTDFLRALDALPGCVSGHSPDSASQGSTANPEPSNGRNTPNPESSIL